MLKTKFRREITIILLIKLTLLYGLWSIYFKDTKHKPTGSDFAKRVYEVQGQGSI